MKPANSIAMTLRFALVLCAPIVLTACLDTYHENSSSGEFVKLEKMEEDADLLAARLSNERFDDPKSQNGGQKKKNDGSIIGTSAEEPVTEIQGVEIFDSATGALIQSNISEGSTVDSDVLSFGIRVQTSDVVKVLQLCHQAESSTIINCPTDTEAPFEINDLNLSFEEFVDNLSGVYRIQLFASDFTTGDTFDFFVKVSRALIEAPLIKTQKQEISRDEGGSLSLSIDVTGTEPMTYQWFKDGALLENQTTKQLSLADLQPSDDAMYAARASNAQGSHAALIADLTVNPKPIEKPAGEATKSVSRVSGGTEFTWKFNCNGRPCQYGQFVNGSFWVAPIDDLGNTVSAVTITSITPEGEQHGAQVNPNLDPNSDKQYQGLLSSYQNQPPLSNGWENPKNHYDPALNIMTQLPYDAKAGESIMKIEGRYGGNCGTNAIKLGCVATGDVLTILGSIPEARGKYFFRPPFHGDAKPLYDSRKLKLDRIPQIAKFTVIDGDSTTHSDIVATIQDRWTVPQFDINHNGFSGEFFRGTSPHNVMDDYAAEQATQYVVDLINVFGQNPIADKLPAITGLVQKGIDNYAIFKMGIKFSSGAGQHLGKKAPIAFFAALYDDNELLEEVRSIASDPQYFGFFQEDTQVFRGKNGTVIWGDTFGGDFPLHEMYYWTGYYWSFLLHFYGLEGWDGNGTAADPYGYIDGPAGGADPEHPKGRSYIYCCSAGPIIAYAFVQHLMPMLKYAAGDPEVLEFSDRIYRGVGINNFIGGAITQPDYCAPVDPREDFDNCNPWGVSGQAGCKYYGGNKNLDPSVVTWGPDPLNPGECIKHNGNPYTDGRWLGKRHGFDSSIQTLEDIDQKILNLPWIVKNNWDEFR